MKRLILLCITFMFLFSCINVCASEMKMYLNGIEVPALAEKHQPATIVDGCLYLPLRNVYEAIGAVVKWDKSYNLVSGGMGGMNYETIIDSNKFIVNGKEYDVKKVIIMNDRALVAPEIISICFNATVDWDGASNNIFINYQSNEDAIMIIDFSEMGDD